MKRKRAFVLTLHSHLPYVLSHGVWPHGTDWLNEALSETYIPILNLVNELVRSGVQAGITLGITPILAEQLSQSDFTADFQVYIKQKIRAAESDYSYFNKQGDKALARLSEMWREHFKRSLTDFDETYKQDIIGSFKQLQDNGHIEIITSAATHGYLPLLGLDQSVEAQVKVGCETYERHFARKPRGIWLPECAYRPAYHWKYPKYHPDLSYERRGVEEVLAENGLHYFFVDTHLLKGGKESGFYAERFQGLKLLWERMREQISDSRPDHLELSPYRIHWLESRSEKPVAFFTRDPRTSLQVWSGEHGYPGDFRYLEFHKKHFPGGHRYWRVSSADRDLGAKEVYQPEAVADALDSHAAHFVETLETVAMENDEQEVIVSMFDTELFGHWWFEGPEWIKRVILKVQENSAINLTTAATAFSDYPPRISVKLPEGSWGEGGHHFVWYNEENSWSWDLIYEAEERMQKAANAVGPDVEDLEERILRQMVRELLLLQSSDWQFLITTISARDYAESRLQEHYRSFKQLDAMLIDYRQKRELSDDDLARLSSIELRDSVFPEADYRMFLNTKK